MLIKKILIAVACCFPLASFSQKAADSIAVRDFLSNIQQAYDKASYLAFEIKYLYANRNTPGKYIDSVKGTMEMDRKRSRTVIDGLETMITEKYAIRIDSEEKLIYLGRPSSNGASDPMSMVENAIYGGKGTRAFIITTNGVKELSIKFPSGNVYTSIVMTVDETTRYLQRIKYELRTTDLVTDDMLAKPGTPGLYQEQGNVEVVFSNYREGAFTDSLFNESLYFIRQAREFIPSARYKDYRIFLASSNL